MSQDKILGDGRYKVGRALGHGGFSVVYACTEVETGEEYAVKVLNKEKVRNAKMEEAFERECMALRRMHNCPYITNAKEILQSTRNYYVIMDLADRGSLLQKIVTTTGGRGLNPAAVRRYFTQLMLGVRDMHSVEIVHRDIKPENLLLDARMNLHISDFGFAARADTSRYLKRQCGTPQYVAPEVIKGLPYIGQYADIWSCGVTLYVMLCGHLPFAAPDNERLYEQILQGRYRPPRRGDGMPEVPIAALHLLACCLAMDPTKRWSAEQLLKHPYLEGSDDIILVDPKGVDPLGMLNGSFCDAAYTPPEFVPSEACDLVPQNGMPRKSISCPTLSELLFLGIDVYNDPQLGRPRARRGRRGSMGRQYESQDLMLESCTGAEDDGTREGLGSRSTLRMLKHTSYTDDPSFARATSRSDLSQDRSEDATPSFLPLSQSDSGPQRGRDSPSVDIIHRRTPSTNFAHVSPRVASRQRLTPLQTQTPGTSSTTSPPQPKKRFGLAHIFQFFNFVLVCFVVLLVGILKIMFDVKLNRIPMPRAVREMAASLIDGVGLGEAANPVLSAEDDAQRRTTTPKAKAA